MVYFTKYAEEKFEILQRHQVFFTKEMVKEAIEAPEKETKKGGYVFAQKEGYRVVYKKDKDGVRIFTFYPVKK